ncbi:hypothetical protein [uncultured Pseudonocardia sp.]|jgi:hypothetical protein|uniref:hypothetical protein n=1 Tax=uncultured Pseudonocardia sp. TaxID=211455 RepID=UPI00263932CA|nr:hypothetical protein [uncultured Pseudonocardia sp.]
MSENFDQLATLPGAFVQVATSGRCVNEFMVVGPGAVVGDHIPCDAQGCGEDHEIRQVIAIELVPTIEIPPARRGRDIDSRGAATRARARQGLERGGLERGGPE